MFLQQCPRRFRSAECLRNNEDIDPHISQREVASPSRSADERTSAGLRGPAAPPRAVRSLLSEALADMPITTAAPRPPALDRRQAECPLPTSDIRPIFEFPPAIATSNPSERLASMGVTSQGCTLAAPPRVMVG